MGKDDVTPAVTPDIKPDDDGGKPVKLPELASHTMLKQIAVGRTPREMGALIHAAHEELMWEQERTKFQAMKGKAGTMSVEASPADLTDLQTFLFDGEGTNHIDVALGLVITALQAGDMAELEFKLWGLVKACVVALPHVRQQLEMVNNP